MENTPKKKNWFASHKIISTIIGLFILVSLINGISTGGKGIQTTNTPITTQIVSSNSSTTEIANSKSQQQTPVVDVTSLPPVSTNTITTSNPQPVQTIKISSSDLYNAYQNNEIAAGQKYQDKTLEVHGTINSIGKDILGAMYVGLSTPNSFNTVECMVDDSQTQKVSTLSKGQNLTVIGTVQGYSLGIVVLNNCTIQ